MKKDFRPRGRWIQHFRHVYLAFFLSYLVMLMVPITGIVYLYRQVYAMEEKARVTDALNCLQAAGSELNARIAWMDSQASRFLLDSQLTKMIYAEPLQYGDKRVNEFTAFSAHLDDLISTYDANDHGYRLLLQDSELVFYRRAKTHGLAFAFEHQLQYVGWSYEQWYDAVFGSNEVRLLPVCDIRLGTSPIRALTYNYPILRRSAGGGTRKAVLQFFIEERALYPANFDLRSTAYLLSARQELLAAFGAGAPLPVDLAAQPRGSGYQRLKDGLFVHTEIAGGWVLAQFIPNAVAFEGLLAMRRPMVLVFLLCAVLEGALCWLLARNNARPIESLAADLSQMLHTSPQGNELEYLHQGIVQLRQSQQRSLETEQESRQAETALLLNHLLHHHNERADALFRLGERVGISLRAGAYCAAVACLQNGQSIDTPPPAPEDGTQIIISEGEGNRLNILYLLAATDSAEAAAQIAEHLRKWRNAAPLRVGVGRVYPSLEDVPFSFDQAVHCLQADESDAITRYDELAPNINAPYFPLEQQQRILNAVKHNNGDVIDQEFETILRENTVKRHLSTLLKRTLLTSIEGLMLNAYEDIPVDENLSDLLRSLHRSGDFREELDVLRREFKRVAERVGGRIAQVENQRAMMERYLEEHYSEPLLSISTMAEHFGLSESYFSVVFKDLMGEPYSACLEKLRLRKACELLTDTTISVEEVSAKVGYNNSTTFRRAFKRITGISPVQYRSQRK